ncbi:MAG: DoxX family protein [Sediminibacterium sp.]|nr:DoxX family protein [Sediminibacterium sp.]MDP3127321.1 DoxX family protein [Sediminibacterium sp.]
MSIKINKIIPWILRIGAAVILFQTLFFKFGAQPEAVELFTKLGIEPWERIGTGIIELITGVLLIIPSTAFLGSLLGVGLMSGAIILHLTIIGIESKDDGGQLFILAIAVLVCCLITMLLYKKQGVLWYNKLFKKEILQ